VAVALSSPGDPWWSADAPRIMAEMAREEAAFAATLSKGQKLLDETLAKALGSSSSNKRERRSSRDTRWSAGAGWC